MGDDSFTLATFYTAWKAYQDRLAAALAPLSTEQLDLRAGPRLRSIGENALHVVGCRAYWFTQFLRQDGGARMQAYTRWNEVALGAPYASWDHVAQSLGVPVLTAAELAHGLDCTWQFMADCLAHWSPADMRETVPDVWDGAPVEVSRAWVVWHVLEHDLHHGGEISLILGMHGIPTGFAA